ncbi:MAG TPA: hypothetical protein VMZ30_08015 [Pyrinomonadaceae bacterium]|nr:hypothetical protein [Pyrinomonadaceae bacterium]
MIKERPLNLVRAHGGISRLLSVLLLGFIVYGTTVEAAHTHGGLLTANSVTGPANFSGPGTDLKEATTLLGCGECLICQLHQNFSATLISVPPSIAHTSLGSRFVNPTTLLVHSQTTTPRTGRAPPLSL